MEKRKWVTNWLLWQIGIILVVGLFLLLMKLDQIQKAIEDRSEMDSLYIDHLKDCSMIRKDQILVDEDGIIRSTYHVDPNILNYE